MAEFVKFVLEDGSEAYFETAESDLVAQHSGDPQVSDGGPLQDRLAAVAQTAEQISRSLRAKLTPDAVTLEFGVKVAGEVNWWFFAKNQGEATIKVTATWSRDPSDSGPGTQASKAG